MMMTPTIRKAEFPGTVVLEIFSKDVLKMCTVLWPWCPFASPCETFTVGIHRIPVSNPSV